MRIIAGLFLSLLFVVPAPAIAAEDRDDYFDSLQVATLVKAQEFLFDDQFSKADSALLDYGRQHPDEPAGLLFRASSLLAQMVDREESNFQYPFDSLLDRAQNSARTQLSQGSARHRAWMHLFCGHVAAYRSIYSSHFGSFASAMKNGFEAKSEYQQALRDDSSLLDIYAGLGSFHYWKSAKAGFLRWIGIFRNDRERGIAELGRAAESSLISREAARNSLIWVYFDCGKVDSAEALVRQAMTRYPNGKSFLWPLAQSYFDRELYQKGIDIYTEIRDRIIPRPGNYYNFVECDYFIAVGHDKLDQAQKAIESARNLEQYYDAIPRQTRKRQQGKLGYLKRLASTDE